MTNRIVPLFVEDGQLSIGYDGSRKREYLVYGPDDLAALNGYISSLGSSDWPKVIDKFGIENVAFSKMRDRHGSTEPYWHVTASFNRKKPEAGSYRVSFDTTGATVRIFQALETVGQYGDYTDHAGAIEVKEGKPEGVEIVIPSMRYDVEATIFAGHITSSYVKNVAAITGTTNSQPLFGHAAGELLFLGCSGTIDVPLTGTTIDAQDVTLRFAWAASPNITGKTFGEISGVDKKGHDYMWVEFEQQEDAGKVVTKAKAIYVERVYAEADHLAVTKIGQAAPE